MLKELIINKVQTESGKLLDEFLYCHGADCQVNELYDGVGRQPKCCLRQRHQKDLIHADCPYDYNDILRYRNSKLKSAEEWASCHCSECEKAILNGSFYGDRQNPCSIYDDNGILRQFCSLECYEKYQMHEPYLSLRAVLDGMMVPVK